jgi:hypothetical protein
MTVSTTIIKNSHNGNGSTTTFAYSFKIFADSDLVVIIRSSTGTETTKTLTTHYTVTGAGSASGGTVVFTSGNIPASGETVVIRRNVPQTQVIDYIANDPFPAETHEEGLDRNTMIAQQVSEATDRSIKLSRTNTMTSTEFTVGATDRANKVLSFDSSGELAVTQELGTFRGNWSASTAYQVRDLVKDTSTNNIFIVNTAHTSSGSQPLTTNTNSAKYDLIVDAATATTSSTSAANSATAAANSATASANSATASANSASAASTSETNAASSASTASTQATNSANSATASANSASAAAATFDLFDDSYLGAKSSNPTVDNDGNALQDGALYFDTTNDVMKVYNLSTTTWLQLTPTVSNQNNINTVAGISSNVTSVANISSDVTTVAGISSDVQAVENISANVTSVANIDSNVTTVAGIASNVTSVAGISSNVTTVAGISSAVSNVSSISSAVSAVNSNSSNINTVAGSITNVNNVGGSIANVNTVATNLASVNNFGEVYRIASSAPTTSLNSGDLYFNTSTNVLNVYGASGWQNAGSSVNGTSQRYNYTATNGQTTFTGADNNGGNTLAYDAGFIDVYLNGVKLLNGTDVTVTSGSSVVLASGATTGDVVDIVAFGTFSVASLNASNLTSGTVPSARVSGAYTGITQTGTLASFASTGIDDNATSTAITIDSSERVGIGSTAPGTDAGANADSLVIKKASGNVGMSIITDGSSNANIFLGDTSDDLNALIQFNDSANELRVGTTNGGGDLVLKSGASVEALRIDDTGNVGIGNTVMSSFSNLPATNLVVGSGSGNQGITIYSGNTSASNIGFADASTGNGRNQGIIQYHHDGDYMRFFTSATERIRIDSSGNLGIGTSSPSAKLHVDVSNSGVTPNSYANTLFIESSSNTGLTIASGTSSYSSIYFANSTDNDKARIEVVHSDNSMRFTNNASERMRILSTGGITFNGDTAQANALDDYEEGTWTPTAYSGITSLSVNDSQNTYTKVGRLVTVYCEINGFGGKSSGTLNIGGLPFTPDTNSKYLHGAIDSDGGALGVSRTNSTTGRINFYLGTTSRTTFTGNNLGSGARISLTYFAA